MSELINTSALHNNGVAEVRVGINDDKFLIRREDDTIKFTDSKGNLLSPDSKKFYENNVSQNNMIHVSEMIGVAQSYYNVRWKDSEKTVPTFVYNSSNTVLSNNYDPNSEEFAGAIDCSTYIGLVLRGIPFEKSPYAHLMTVKDENDEDLNSDDDTIVGDNESLASDTGEFEPSSLVANTQDYSWAINPFEWSNKLVDNVRPVRTASQLAQWMYERGQAIPLDETFSNVQRGDIIFWAKKDESGNWVQPNRFKNISHVAMCVNVMDAPTNNFPSGYPKKHTMLEVTSSKPYVLNRSLEKCSPSSVVMVCRPDLGALSGNEFTGNVNLLLGITNISNLFRSGLYYLTSAITEGLPPGISSGTYHTLRVEKTYSRNGKPYSIIQTIFNTKTNSDEWRRTQYCYNHAPNAESWTEWKTASNDFVALADGTEIAKNTDLDTILAFGNYKCTNPKTVKTLLNCPVTAAFIMRVGSPAPGVTNYLYQEIITLRGQRHYRYSYNDKVKDEETGKDKDVLRWLGWRHSFETVENISSDLGEMVHLKACQKFVDKMNETAKDIGMNNTIFKTPSGLYRNMVNINKGGSNIKYNNKTTARDLLRAMVAVKHTPTILKVMGAARCDYFRNSGTYYTVSNIVGNSVWKAWAYKHGYTILASKGGSLGGTLSENGPSGILNNTSLIKDSEGNIFAVAVLGLHNPKNWLDSTTYSKGDKVLVDNVTYISLKDDNKNHAITDTTYWKVVTSGGDNWLDSTTYSKGDNVLVDNVTYISLKDDNKNHAITDTTYWGIASYEGIIMRTLIHDLIGMADGEAETDAIIEAKNRTNPVSMAVAKLTVNGYFDDDIMALESGKYYDADRQHAAASTSKIITALVANRYMGNYQCSINYDDLVGGSSISFDVGDEISATDAMNLMLAISDNALATMLARVCGTQMASEIPDITNVAMQSWVTEQIHTSINATWEATY